MGHGDDLLGVVLAAGRGTRMRSRTPKMLHPVCGLPLLVHALRTLREAGAARMVVVAGSEAEVLREAVADPDVLFVRQSEPRGTGHAVLQARDLLDEHPGPVMVMYGDHALFRGSTFGRLRDRFTEGADLALLTGDLPDPTGYGRIVRDADGRVERIIEESEADEVVRRICEVNLGVYVARGPFLIGALARVRENPRRKETLLTDVVEVALGDGARIETAKAEDWTESLGVNTRADLATVESLMRRRLCDQWMSRGVSFVDPAHVYLDVEVEIGEDTVLEPGCALRGRTRVGRASRIAAGSIVEGSVLGDDVFVKPHCWIEDSVIGDRCVIGPSAHLRPGTELSDEVRVGNFVEIKNSRLGRGTKADHLSYIGDADVGAGVTIGCGAITVNYDGVQKNRTRIGDDAFVGCNANLIAPVTVDPGAYVAAGSTITKDVPPGSLGVARARQRNIEGWRARRFGSPPKRED